MASIAILGMMVVLLFTAFNQASKAWTQGENRVETFQQARAALDMISKELSQAIVSTNVPFAANYDSLAFIAPVSDAAGDGVDLMEVVYRLSWFVTSAGNDPNGVFVDHNYNWPKKLVRRVTYYSANNASPIVGWSYGTGSGTTTPWDFYSNVNWPETSASNRTAIVADNIMSINYVFYDSSLNPTGYWNSTSAQAWRNELETPLGPGAPLMTNRAPKAVQITLGVIDSRAARRLKAVAATAGTLSAAYRSITNEATQYFTTYVSIPNRTP